MEEKLDLKIMDDSDLEKLVKKKNIYIHYQRSEFDDRMTAIKVLSYKVEKKTAHLWCVDRGGCHFNSTWNMPPILLSIEDSTLIVPKRAYDIMKEWEGDYKNWEKNHKSGYKTTKNGARKK